MARNSVESAGAEDFRPIKPDLERASVLAGWRLSACVAGLRKAIVISFMYLIYSCNAPYAKVFMKQRSATESVTHMAGHLTKIHLAHGQASARERVR